MRAKIPILALVLALCLTVAGLALANGGIARPRWVLSGGASNSAGGGATVRGTLGQPVVGVVSGGGGDVTLGQGFWPGGGLPEGGYRIHLPLVIRG
jgi:hypothetical protein